MRQIIIQHVQGSSPAGFSVIRPGDARQAGPYAVPSPLEAKVGERRGVLMAELAWYLERFLEYPGHPNDERAAQIVRAIEDWGAAAFNALFDNKTSGVWVEDAAKDGYKNLQLVIKSDDAEILQWPWQALRDPQAAYLALACRLERQLNTAADLKPLGKALPAERINILMVTARPLGDAVDYQTISRPLVELVEQQHVPAYVHILRPPTFDNLRAHLKAKPHFYHILHFDGHGSYGALGSAGLPLAAQPAAFAAESQGFLAFEDDEANVSLITAEHLSNLLLEHAVPLVVLNACRSAAIDATAKDQFASVATALVKAGARGVVAMSHSIYVSAARIFLPAFYRELFESGDISEATRLGRQQLHSQDRRISAIGEVVLKDFIVPVVYTHPEKDGRQFKLSFKRGGAGEREKAELPDEAQIKVEKYPYGFIGRGNAILEIERALREDCPAVLIHGLGGVDKSTLARGLVNWLNDTGGLAGCLWLNFQGVKSAEFVINATGIQLFGADFAAQPMDTRIELLAKVLRENSIILVWDNFEDVAGIEGTYVKANMEPEDREHLKLLLAKIRKGRSKVLITSRSEEDWLKPNRRVVRLGGLRGEELWEYSEAILKNLGVTVYREDKALIDLLDELDGHPLALDTVLPVLEHMPAAAALAALKQNREALGPAAEKLHAGIKLVLDRLPDEEQPLLIPLALHEKYLEERLLEMMIEQAAPDMPLALLPSFLGHFSIGGLIGHLGQGIYVLHPALTGYLRTYVLPTANKGQHESWRRAFVDIMGSLADALAPKELHEQRTQFSLHFANFHFALDLAVELDKNSNIGALTQSLAQYALHCRHFSEATRLYLGFAELQRTAGRKEHEASAYHQSGMIAEEQRDFSGAKRWYYKSLTIKKRQGNEYGAAITYHQLGILAQEQRDFTGAKKWYLKSLAIKERQGDEQGAARTYHNLGSIAQEQRDYVGAEKWYRKSLAIEEKQGNEYGAAITYHQLGILAQEQRDFTGAKKWYLKSLAIKERQGDEQGAARTYHNLGSIAQEQRDYAGAEKWYRKSLAIKEEQGDEYGAAITYHQLGMIIQEQCDSARAEEWYLKSLAIEEKQGDEHGAASTYHQLGMIAQEQRDFARAEEWYLKSLAISEKQGNEHGAASTFTQLGLLARGVDDYLQATKWYIKALVGFANTNDLHNAQLVAENFMIDYEAAPPELQVQMKKLWEEHIGKFPSPGD